LNDVVALAQDLLRCPSITPADAGAQDVLAARLEAIGFTVARLKFGEIFNIYAQRPGPGPRLCFAGHTDVVPPGESAWTHGPFSGAVAGTELFGRGAVDMKGAVAAFVAAAAQTTGNLSLVITGDEEGPAVDGTVRILDWMASQPGTLPAFCIVGEPTSQQRVGDTVKIGRRGSLSVAITINGTQGHAAYPQKADNPVHRLVRYLSGRLDEVLDDGTPDFEPSRLTITSIDVDNPATNVIPARATAKLNIRFNDLHTSETLLAWLRSGLEAEMRTFDPAHPAPSFTLAPISVAESFRTASGPHTDALVAAIHAATGLTPAQTTGGGTSDARFFAARGIPVAELGLVGTTMHQRDERVPVADLATLTEIYRHLIVGFCGP
jgi:succinyl-diaminopimelate desuccinylase